MSGDDSQASRDAEFRGHPPPIAWLVPSLAGLVAACFVALPIGRLSVTVDEWRYVHDGVRWWFGGDAVWLIDFGTLPLPFWIQNAPGALYLWLKHGDLPAGLAADFGKTLSLADQLTLLRLARVTNFVLAGLGTIVTVWLLAYRTFGAWAAAAAAALCAVEPNLLAGYALATGDGVIVPCALLLMLVYPAYVRQPTVGRLLLTAGVFGLGVALKVSMLPIGLLLMGATFVVRLIGLLAGGERSRARAVRSLLRFFGVDVPAVAGLGLVVAWVANGCLMGWLLDPAMPNKLPHRVVARLGYEGTEASHLVAQLQALRVPAPLAVIRSQAGHSRWGHPMTFLGRTGLRGPWYYYPTIFLMKSHIVLLTALAGLLTAAGRRSPAALGAALLLGLSCLVGIKGGPRYFLVLYALLAILGGAGIAAMLHCLAPRMRFVAAAALIVLALVPTWRSLPDLLTHTNLPWGGDDEGYRYADANYDWGQGLDEAAAAAHRIGLHPIVYLHTGDPSFGVPPDREVLSGSDPEVALDRMRGRFAAVSVHRLYHSGAEASPLEPLTRSLAALGPDGRLCRTYFFFDLRAPSRHTELSRLVEHASTSRPPLPVRASLNEGARRQ
ncbi:MAG: glycosyltransferase family 39 protein [Isosphaeraceae bacterium]|nr:glycosyltransferase family 39 protein [Isosphaeraceae bacterium]